MRILVIGANGIAGFMVVAYLRNHGYDVTTVDTEDTDINLDIQSPNDIVDFIAKLTNHHEYIVNCLEHPEYLCDEESLKAILINTVLPHHLEEHFKESSTKIIQLSTDLIFNGSTGNYNEQDIPTETSVYARSKVLGELNNDKDVTFRVSVIGPNPVHGTGIIEDMLAVYIDSVQCNTVARWNGITSLELAKCVHKHITNPILTGIVHLTGTDTPGRYGTLTEPDLLRLINDVFSLKKTVVATNGMKSINRTLINNRTKEFNFYIPLHKQMLTELKTFCDDHINKNPETQLLGNRTTNTSNMIKVYVINLQRRRDRRVEMVKQFMKYDFFNYEFIDAVDGSTMTDIDIAQLYDGTSFRETHNRDMAPSEIGCSLSHVKAYEQIINHHKPGELVAIVEDDVTITDNFMKLLCSKDVTYRNKEPAVFFAYCGSDGGHQRPRRKQVIPILLPRGVVVYGDRTKFKSFYGFKFYRPYSELRNIYGTVAYLLTKETAQLFYDYNKVAQVPADRIWHSVETLKYISYPLMCPLTTHPSLDSDIADGRHDFGSKKRKYNEEIEEKIEEIEEEIELLQEARVYPKAEADAL